MTRREARKAADEILRDLNQGHQVASATLTFQDFVDHYFIPNVFPTLKPSTQKRDRHTLTHHLLPAFGKQRLCDIGTLDLQRFILAKMQAGLSWEYAHHFRCLMSKIYKTAKKWGYINTNNPAAGVELPPKTTVREKHILSLEEIPTLLAALREPVRTMVQLAVLSGLRIGELLGLTWKHVDFAKAEIHIVQAYYRGSMGTPKTKHSTRIVPLASVLKERLLQLRSQPANSEDLVFCTSNGTPYNDSNLLHRELKPAGRKLGMPWLNWHTLRRTHATLFQVAGGSLRDAQAQLGHSKMSTTLEIYTLPIPAQQRATVEKLADLMSSDGKSSENPQAGRMLTTQIQ